MIIRLNQRQTVLSHEFDVYYDNDWRFGVKMGIFSGLQKTKMDNPRRDLHYLITFQLDKHLFTPEAIRTNATLSSKEQELVNSPYCSFRQEMNEAENLYTSLNKDEAALQIRSYATGAREYLTVYQDDFQIALAEYDRTVYNGCQKYVLYLLSDFEHLSDALTICLIRHHALHNIHPFENRNNTTALRFKRYGSPQNAGYEEDWLDEHFPDTAWSIL